VKVAAGALLFSIALAGCGTPQKLPVEIPWCDAIPVSHGVIAVASVRNKASKPISGLVVAIDFYRNFRYARVQGVAKLPHVLDPGQERHIVFKIAAAPSSAEGRAMRCFATHISYLDGTSEDVTVSR
jgi:hypothetical protein